MRSSDTATRIVLRSENGWMTEQIDLQAIEHLFLARTGDDGRRPSRRVTGGHLPRRSDGDCER